MKRQKLTKAELVENIYQSQTGDLGRGEIKAVVDLFIEQMKVALAANQVIELRGFGTFEVRSRKGREHARNPKTGQIASVENHGVPIFRPGKELKQKAWPIVDQDGRKVRFNS